MKAEEIKGLINHLERYEAHSKSDENGIITERETLLEHTERTVWYFEQLGEEKDISAMLSRFYLQMYGGLSEKAVYFWREMITGIPIFHDLGKINPDFQRRKLHNDRVED